MTSEELGSWHGFCRDVPGYHSFLERVKTLLLLMTISYAR